MIVPNDLICLIAKNGCINNLNECKKRDSLIIINIITTYDLSYFYNSLYRFTFVLEI